MQSSESMQKLEPLFRQVLLDLVADQPRAQPLSLSRGQMERLPSWLRNVHLAPLAYTQLKQSNEMLGAHLRDDYYAAVVRTERQTEYMRFVLGRLVKAGLPVMLLKGAAVMPLAYKEPYHRFMSDLDLAVTDATLARAWDALKGTGVKLSRPDLVKATHGPPVDGDGKIELISPNYNDAQLDLHTRIFPGFWLRELGAVDEMMLWQRREPFNQQNQALFRLSNEDLVLHNLVHMAINHQFDRFTFRNLIDLFRLHHRISINWPLVAERAAAWQVRYPVWLGLYLLVDFFGTASVPANGSTFAPIVAARDTLAPSLLRQRRLLSNVSPQTILNLYVLRLSYRRFLFLPMLAQQSTDLLKLGRQLPSAFLNRTGT